MRLIIALLILCSYHVSLALPYGIQISKELDLGTIKSGIEYEISVDVTNTSVNAAKVTPINAFATMDLVAPIYRSINVSANSTASILYKFTPTQNIDYEIYLYNLVEHWDNAYPVATLVKAKVQHDNQGIYDFTDNLWGSELLKALSVYLKSHNSLSYKNAREHLWTSFDNDDGIVKCVYTGKSVLVSGEPDFAELDKNGFNTEHTWPRSYGADYEPPLSDMNHIFPTSKTANDRRANFPYDYVTGQISWQDGGSKLGIGSKGKTVFEPRDDFKGNVSRALFYFALRYDNPFKFLNDQEPILREWMKLDPPDEKEMRRNDSIAFYQLRRNPFIDNPSLLDRINSVSGEPDFSDDIETIQIGNNFILNLHTMKDTTQFNLWVHNDGQNAADRISYSITESQNLQGKIKYDNSNDKILGKHGLSHNFEIIKPELVDDETHFAFEIIYEDGNTMNYVVSIIDGLTSIDYKNDSEVSEVRLYPNPTTGTITIELNEFKHRIDNIAIYDLEGKKIDPANYKISFLSENKIFVEIKKLKAFGNVFIIRMECGGIELVKKFIIVD